jgi:hypothetical protein
MLLSAHQPVYLPGIILFNKIALSDLFVLLTHVQFERSSWQMRNCIRSGETSSYLSVPVEKKGQLGEPISAIQIAGDGWKSKHLKTMYFTYKNRPFFDDYFPAVEKIITDAGPSICELNCRLIRHLCRCLGVETPIVDSAELDIEGAKNALLISICKRCGADAYVSNIGARAYVDDGMFAAAGITHHWQNFRHPVYEQGKTFLPNLSVVDLLFNVGPAAGDMIKDSGNITKVFPEQYQDENRV